MTRLTSSKMTTVSGLEIDPFDPAPNDIDEYDIAHALSRQCRYNGHVGNFLSVARHSIWVSERLVGRGPAIELWGLLHDASEAYVGDVISPIKHQPELRDFVDAEDRIQWAVAKKFGLEYPMPEIVHDADKWVTVEYEMAQGYRWSHNTTYAIDEDAFLNRFDDLIERVSHLNAVVTGVTPPKTSNVRTPNLIGLAGYAGAGKNVVGSALHDTLGYELHAFADNMRSALLALNPSITDFSGLGARRLAGIIEEFGWDRAKRQHPEIRALLQRFGTEVGRKQFGADFWVELALDDIKQDQLTVFTDVRFPNEADAIKAMGGEVWRIMRSNVGPANDHLSEHALDDWDHYDVTFFNNCPIEDLPTVVLDTLGKTGYSKRDLHRVDL